MSLAGYFSNVFNPQKKIISLIIDLIKLVENDRTASLLLSKIDGVKRELSTSWELERKYQDLLNEVLYDIRVRIPGIKILFEEDPSITYRNGHYLLKGTILIYGKVIIEESILIEDGLKPTIKQREDIARRLLINLTTLSFNKNVHEL